MSVEAVPLEETIRIAAPAARVWEIIGDPRRLAELSPQVASVRLRDGFDELAVGVQFTNRNERGDFAWVTHGEIVRYEAPSEIAFQITENYIVWSFSLAADGDATVVTHRRDAPEGLSEASDQAITNYFGGHEAFTAEMIAGMRETLERLRAAVESR